jgi:hypothetical protein
VQAQQPEQMAPKGAPVIPFPAQRAVRPSPLQQPRPVVNDGSQRRPAQPGEGRGAQDLSDMEIPTFIRRQMD